MVSANVYNVAKSELAANVNTIADAKTKANSIMDSFGSVFNMVSGGNRSEKENIVAKKADDVSENLYSSETYRKDGIKEQATDKAAGFDEEKVKELNETIKEEIKDKFKVSDEELEEVMDKLGLEYYQLLMPKNLTALASELTGSEDAIMLLSNCDFSDLYQTLSVLAENVATEMNLTQEGLYVALEELAAESEVVVTQMQTETMDMNLGEVLVADENLQENATDMTKEIMVEITDEVSENEEGLVNDKNSSMSIDETPSETAFSNEDSLMENENTDSKRDNHSLASENRQMGIVTNDFGRMAHVEGVVEEFNLQGQMFTESILQQVQEGIRVNLNGMDASMEMQLNPENLGKLSVAVALEDGVITAKITTQNQDVKEILENQIVFLREEMNSQGLKVEAIEVTIASHEFEQNLDESNSNRDNPYENENNKSKTDAGLRFGFDEEMLIDEDELTSRIMNENGNTMNVTA